jgi:hypothetical protein
MARGIELILSNPLGNILEGFFGHYNILLSQV